LSDFIESLESRQQASLNHQTHSLILSTDWQTTREDREQQSLDGLQGCGLNFIMNAKKVKSFHHRLQQSGWSTRKQSNDRNISRRIGDSHSSHHPVRLADGEFKTR
jgi:hypothetical protein